MADNIDEEHLGNSTSNQSENPRDEIIPANDTEPINPNQETENMEVHHHPDLHHKPKKWKEYFLEFLMIFLAVTLGFIGENVREGISENGKAHELAESLYNEFVRQMTATLGQPVATGQFAAMMQVTLVIDGPVTLIIDTKVRE